MKATEAQIKVNLSLLGVEPTPEQMAVLLCWKRYLTVVGGERAGKSHTTALYLMVRWHERDGGKDPLYWIVGKDYERCRAEFQYCLEFSQKIMIKAGDRLIPLLKDHRFPENDQCSLFWIGGGKIVTKSLRDPLKIGSEAPDGIMLVEAAQNNYDDYMRLLNRTAEKRGWLLASGTFEGSQGWYPDLYNKYQVPSEIGQSFSIPSWTNSHIFPGGREDPEIKLQENMLPEDRFLERFGGVPCPPARLVCKEFRPEIHVGNYPFMPDVDVELYIDPGYAGAYAVEAVQWQGDTMYIIDEVYLKGYITDDIIEIVTKKPWWQKVTGGAIDIAARQHQAMPAPVEVWQSKTGLYLRSQKVDEEMGIDRLRSFLKPHPVTHKPNIFVNSSAKGFISECGGGPSPFLDGSGGAWLRDENTLKPIDKNNHACKAVIYGIISKYGYTLAMGASYKPVSYVKWGNRRKR